MPHGISADGLPHDDPWVDANGLRRRILISPQCSDSRFPRSRMIRRSSWGKIALRHADGLAATANGRYEQPWELQLVRRRRMM